MKIEHAKAALAVASGRRRVRVAEAEGKADRLREKLKRSRQREAPRRRWLSQDVVAMARMAGEGRSAGEIAETLGSTRGRVAAQLAKYRISLAPKHATETCVRVTLRKDAVAALTRLAVDRDVPLEVFAADLLAVAGREPVLVANLLDEGE